MISYDDFEKVDIRVGRIVSVEDFPEARKSAFRLEIDFGPEVGIKTSSVQAVGAHKGRTQRNAGGMCSKFSAKEHREV